MFREDLYYRLNILKINLPALRERKEDILSLVDSFIKGHLQQLGKEDIQLSNKVKDILTHYDWPGNIRQLKNICERLVVLSQFSLLTDGDIEKIFIDCGDDNSHPLSGTPPANTQISSTDKNTMNGSSSFLSEIKQLERVRIKEALEKNRYNKTKAAKMLGINRTTLWRRMKELNIEDLLTSSG
ncbi:helix-turn-helix domain-containing protein [Petroclostridium sp. X23]|uniref:helix-turn-helix domain-containing protein n=1 Tax=Petroclostridium sp. X23 TaxID=3045146 RepID=UPI0024AC840C|nr:helix-turn-helix domain-containing protein [Petroclostridium sp. X23]WHH57991.1 helix-turn-helix domain-containing protein [Petroclostridium sp. X23]